MYRFILLSIGAMFLSTGAIAGDSVEIIFTTDIENKEIASLNVELGGYDVTHLSEIGDGKAVVRLDASLSPGQYTAVVLAFYQNGEIQTIAEQTVTIGAAAGDQWQFNSTLETSYRTDQDNDQDYSNVRRSHGNAGLDGQYSHRQGQWTVSASGQALYDSNTEGSGVSNEWQLPTYRLGADYENDAAQFGFSLGDFQIEAENLLYSSYQRRAVGLTLNSKSGQFTGKVFSAVSDVTTAYDENLLPNESANRTLGMTSRFSPLANQPDRLILSLGYVDGEGTLTGSGITNAEPGTVYGGDAWNAGLDSLWLDRALWLHLEYAGSSFDTDGIGFGNGKQDDDAHKIMLQASSSGQLPMLGFDYWSLTLTRQQVGPDFYSMANLVLPGDILSDRATLNFIKGGMNITAEVAREVGNVDDRVDRATQTMRYAGVDLNYSPAIDPQGRPWSLLGMPVLSAYAHVTDTAQKDSDSLINSIDVDNRVHEYNLGISFNHEKWGWGLSHTRTETDDDSFAVFQNAVEVYTPSSDTRNELSVLQFNWYPNSRLRLSPMLQWTRFKELDNGNTNDIFNLGIDAYAELLPEKLILDLNYSVDQNDTDYTDPLIDDSSYDNYTGNVKLTWKIEQPKASRPGADLFIKGSFGRQEDNLADSSIDNWQLYLGLAVYWSGNNDR
ncbi:MAG: hypothetical protein PVG66_09770 [Chromatiales bacterium]|jgi:hypothetical protein